MWVADDGTLTGNEGWEPACKKLKSCVERPIPKTAKGESFDDVVKSLGDDIVFVESKK